MLRYDNLGTGGLRGRLGRRLVQPEGRRHDRGGAVHGERGTAVDVLVGHSLGGAAALAAAGGTNVRAVVSIAAPIDPGHAENQYDALVDRVLSRGAGGVAGRRPGADAAPYVHGGHAQRRPA